MDMPMGGGGAPLNDSGVDFSNETQALDFLQLVLDDSEFQVDGNAYARAFWYGVVVVIGVAAIFNIIRVTTLNLRVRMAAKKQENSARPKTIVMRSLATVTALGREIAYPRIVPAGAPAWFKIPSMGSILLLLTYLAFVLVLEFANNDIPGAQHYTALAVRAGWLAVAQVPLLILLAGKNNLIGLFTGASYARLNVIHRWVARMLLLLSTIHLGTQNYGWNEFGLRGLEWSTDTCPPTGIAAYAILLWLNLSTLAPFRHLAYEFFVIQHIVTFFGFIIAVMIHLPTTALYSRIYIYIPIVLWFLDRTVRSVRYLFNNVRPGRATLEAMEGGVTRIRVASKRVTKWSPGAFVLLSIPTFGFGQSHPATIASTPSSHSHDLVFILKGHRGFTSRILKSVDSSSIVSKKEAETQEQSYVALIDGPYSSSHSDFAAFDTVVLISGSTGVTFTLSILLDLAHRATTHRLPVRTLEFIWVIKNTSWIHWIADELGVAYKQLCSAGIETTFSIFVTCDSTFSSFSTDTEKSPGCQCDKSLGPCCCISVVDGDAPQSSKETATAASCSAKSHSILRCATLTSGRPSLKPILWRVLGQADGETGIAVCGPFGLNSTVRNTVATISDERAVHKGTGAQGIYLHAEDFAF
ncbi:ferric reductase NAD binding domain-containing protein [Lipomyces kononenkoae]|uniref:Ferric reductase NAD binding domain-containing protein n=1 Tax=Lipomyces kononenkoae TaxID=34357 RepID=A0ACC3SU51_LIPKO